MRSKKISLLPEGGYDLAPLRAAADALQSLRCEVPKLPNVLGAEVGQLALLPIAPKIFDRVEFRSVSGQVGDCDSLLVFLHVAADPEAAVDLGAVPDDEELAVAMAPKLSEEGDYLRGPDCPGVNAETEGSAGEPGDGRKLLPVEVELQDRGLADRSPGADPVGPLAQPALVYKDNGAPLPQGFFLRLGHSWLFQASMAASSRSRARLTGRCGLKPIRPKSRQTWTVLKHGPPSLTISVRTRGRVHKSAEYPCRLAPANRPLRSFSSRASSIVLLRPKRHTAPSCFFGVSAQRLTDCRLTLSRRATSACGIPSSRSLRAASLRF